MPANWGCSLRTEIFYSPHSDIDPIGKAGFLRDQYSVKITIPADDMDNLRPPITSDLALAAAIPRAASKQTYSTIHLFFDRGRVDDAYRDYAYFRWVDDRLDREGSPRTDRKLALPDRRLSLHPPFRGGARQYRTRGLQAQGPLSGTQRLKPWAGDDRVGAVDGV